MKTKGKALVLVGVALLVGGALVLKNRDHPAEQADVAGEQPVAEQENAQALPTAAQVPTASADAGSGEVASDGTAVPTEAGTESAAADEGAYRLLYLKTAT
ncbi:MAG: hypothetical protein K9L28_02890 [Synergistales bacterium]|nr:hypothetical protein [Synergistales bacterium]